MPERLTRKRTAGAGLSKQRGQAKPRAGWDEQEEAIAAAVPGGKRVKGSGCSTRRSRKGDVEGRWLRAEGKTTVKAKGIRVERSHLEKIRAEAEDNRQAPLYVFGFDRTVDRPREDWAAFPLSVAECMMAVVEATLQGDHEDALAQAELLAKAVR